MRIYYRGTQYERDPSPLEIPESSVTGYYRGHAFDLKYPRHIPVPQPRLNLNYRGTAYRVFATGELEAIGMAPTVTVRSGFAPSRSISPVRLRNLAEVHRGNIYRSLQHRLKIARASGDRYLIQQLEQEMHQDI